MAATANGPTDLTALLDTSEPQQLDQDPTATQRASHRRNVLKIAALGTCAAVALIYALAKTQVLNKVADVANSPIVAAAAFGNGGNRPHGIPQEKAPPCLCVFDIDRTLTGKQGWGEKCPGTAKIDGAKDVAYGGGTLVLSDLQQNLQSTFCSQCFAGIVTAGTGSGEGSAERANILEALGGTAKTRSDWWQDVNFKPETKVRSSLVVKASDGRKQESLLSMLDWWKDDQHIVFDKSNVFFFDDIKANVVPFRGTGLNAKQISCRSRGPSEWKGQQNHWIGGCGGMHTEALERSPGVHPCPEQ